MRILYYSWQEASASDVIDGMQELGHEVIVEEMPCKDYCVDD